MSELHYSDLNIAYSNLNIASYLFLNIYATVNSAHLIQKFKGFVLRNRFMHRPIVVNENIVLVSAKTLYWVWEPFLFNLKRCQSVTWSTRELQIG